MGMNDTRRRCWRHNAGLSRMPAFWMVIALFAASGLAFIVAVAMVITGWTRAQAAPIGAARDRNGGANLAAVASAPTSDRSAPTPTLPATRSPTAIPSVTATLIPGADRTPANQPSATATMHLIEGVPAGRQTRQLNCEFQSARDLASYYGIELTWEQLFMRVGFDSNGDPYKGVVGRSFDDPPGNLYPDGYGVYADPVARGLSELGVPARAFRNVDQTWLRNEINAGRPVIVWATAGMRLSERTGWYTRDHSKWVDAVRGEHTYIVVGYDASGIYVNDPLIGQRSYYSWQAFLDSWMLLDFMAISVRP